MDYTETVGLRKQTMRDAKVRRLTELEEVWTVGRNGRASSCNEMVQLCWNQPCICVKGDCNSQ